MGNAFRYPRFVGRRDRDDIERAFDRISRSLTSNDVEFLFGAGMSRNEDVPEDQRMPLGTDLAVRLLGCFFPELGTKPPTATRLKGLTQEYPFEAIAEAVEGKLGTRADLTSKLKEILWDDSFDISQAHRDFHAICNWGRRPRPTRFFTTNFDLLLEKTFGGQAVPITRHNARESRKVQGAGKVAIIHLHGRLDGEYQITEADVFKGDYQILHDEFHSALHTADAFVFIGYSMSDPDFRRIYMRYRQEIKNRGEADKKTYLVAPADEFSYRLGATIWDKRGALWIPFDASRFFATLRKSLERREDKRVREAIMKKYNIPPDDDPGFEELVARTAEILRVERSDAVQFLYEAPTRAGGRDG